MKTNGFEQILNKYREWLLRFSPSPAREKGDRWLKALGADGSWSDIDYTCSNRGSSWSPARHLPRMGLLARLYNEPDTPLHEKAGIKKALGKALTFWTERKPSSPNWWHNEIGVPMDMRTFLIHFARELESGQLTAALSVMDQLIVRGIGANLTWSADLGLHYAAFCGKKLKVEEYARLLANEIRIGEEEGIQSDFSFYQHGPRLQQFHYGGAFLSDNVRLAWQLNGTPWAFPAEKIAILQNYVLEGSRWMQRGGFTVPATKDRAVSRPDGLKVLGLDHVATLLAEMDPASATDYESIQHSLSGESHEPLGHRHFPKSDFTVFHRPGFSFFLKTQSDRTLGTEIDLNGENLKGQLLSCGDTYFMRKGDEYHNLAPVWDWTLLPGLTVPQKAVEPLALRREAFTGAVSDGQSGLTVMDSAFGEDGSGWSGHKAWFMHEDRIVCLISDLNPSAQGGGLQTALDQVRQSGTVMVGLDQKTTTTACSGFATFKSVRWVHHGGFAYLLPEPASLEIRSGQVMGSWQSISREQSPEECRDRIFLPILKHENNLSGRSSAYIVTPCVSATEAETLSQSHGVRILQNDGAIQAVAFDDGTWMAVLWKAGKLDAGNSTLETDTPCLILASQAKLWISDPSQKGGPLRLTWKKEATRTLAIPEGGISLEINLI